jgi:hypothetical protein
MLKRTAAVLVGTLVLAGGAYAYADTPSTAPSTAPASAPAAAHPGYDHRGPLRRVVHGDLIVRTKDGFENVTVDRGKVTAVSASSITIERPDGVSVTKAVTAETKFRGVDSVEHVERGKGALVVSKGNNAVLIAQRGGDRPRVPDTASS